MFERLYRTYIRDNYLPDNSTKGAQILSQMDSQRNVITHQQKDLANQGIHRPLTNFVGSIFSGLTALPLGALVCGGLAEYNRHAITWVTHSTPLLFCPWISGRTGWAMSNYFNVTTSALGTMVNDCFQSDVPFRFIGMGVAAYDFFKENQAVVSAIVIGLGLLRMSIVYRESTNKEKKAVENLYKDLEKYYTNIATAITDSSNANSAEIAKGLREHLVEIENKLRQVPHLTGAQALNLVNILQTAIETVSGSDLSVSDEGEVSD